MEWLLRFGRWREESTSVRSIPVAKKVGGYSAPILWMKPRNTHRPKQQALSKVNLSSSRLPGRRSCQELDVPRFADQPAFHGKLVIQLQASQVLIIKIVSDVLGQIGEQLIVRQSQLRGVPPRQIFSV